MNNFSIDYHLQQFTTTGDERQIPLILKNCLDQELYSIGMEIGEYYLPLFPHNESLMYHYSMLCYKVDKRKALKQFINLLSLPFLDENVKNLILKLFPSCLEIVQDDFIYYDRNKIEEIKNSNKSHLVTLTMTTCKRYELFEQTINSFINCCTDLRLIGKWFCVDDNSSEEDRQKMRDRYPFFDFYFKKPEEKGHPQSMNIIRNNVTTPYVFHLEDDWKFFEQRDYISECLEVLHESHSVGQCLINKNYAELPHEFLTIKGGYERATKSGNKFVIHEYCNSEQSKREFINKHGNNPNCSYWPYFSLRPSLLRSEVFQLGEFNETVSHFERDFCNTYIKHGFLSAFLPRVYCKHIGRLTSEIGDSSKINAYSLNNEFQFTGKEEKTKKLETIPEESKESEESEENKESEVVKRDLFLTEKNQKISFVTIVINLERRSDRWEKFVKQNLGFNSVRFLAIDGNKLVSTPQLQRIFDGNDYKMRRGMVGCALSHLQLYVDFIKSNKDFICILEDDIEIVPNFKEKLLHVIKQLHTDWDLVYLGHHIPKEHFREEYHDKNKFPIVEKWSRSKSLSHSLGGTGGYLISHKGALNLLNFINKTGMTNGIDTVQQKSADVLNVYYCTPHLIYSEYFDGTNKPDTDIQFNYSYLEQNIDIRFAEELEFYSSDKIRYLIYKDEIEKLIIEENLTDILFYKSSDKELIYNLSQRCIYPCYTLDNQVLVVVPNPSEKHLQHRFFDRLKVNGVFDISQAIKYEE